MGEVWRARDEVLGRDVAVKVLRAELAGDASFTARFRAEARHTAALAHAGIAQIYDYGEDGERPYLVMELVPGEPLSAVLARRGRLGAPETLAVVEQVAVALQVAHDAGVVHRDVKPGNLLVKPDGDVVVTDFGIARAPDSASITQTGLVVGTAHYLSPEQAAGRPAGPASDVYALGIVAYECLAGRRPFLEGPPVAIALAHVRQDPPPLPDDVPAPVRELVARCLDKEPER
ncbi:MAG: serine/threonine protein kinase, partial [Actinomycetota bacterium]|nr:serine/threonine protein kinase [Actinomycetota bacterium]